NAGVLARWMSTRPACGTTGGGTPPHQRAGRPRSPYDLAGGGATSLHDLHERAAAQLVERETGAERFLFRDRAAVHSAQEVVEQPLSRCGVVEDVADERCLSRFLNEVAEPIGRGAERLDEERVDGGVTRRQLRGIQIPPLVVSVDERVADVINVQAPRAMDNGSVLE